jgi:hypothetical protein
VRRDVAGQWLAREGTELVTLGALATHASGLYIVASTSTRT